MTSTPDTIAIGIELQGVGDNTNTWGAPKNNSNLSINAKLSHGYTTLAITGDTTVSDTNYSAINTTENKAIEITGTLSAAATVTFPSRKRVQDIINSATQTVTVQCSGGTGIAIPSGKTAHVYCDGVDFFNGAPHVFDAAITVAGGATFSGKLSGVTAGSASTDAVNKTQMETAIATAGLPATAGTVLVSGGDTSANYIGSKVIGSGAVSVSTTGAAGTNQSLTISVGDGGLTDGGLQSASFAATAGNAYVFPVGGTVTLPTPTGTRRKIALAPYGYGVSTLSGLVNAASTFILDGNQTITLTDADASMGWV